MSQTVTPRRTTRSSAGSPPDPASPTSPSKSRPRRQLIPTAAAAAKEVEGEDERSAIDALLEALPCCRAQASDLLRLLAPSSALPLLLHGGAATGKTRVLLLTLRHIRPYPRSRPAVCESAVKAAQNYGMGPRGSALICGYTTHHKLVEESFAELKKKEDCLHFAVWLCLAI